MDDKLTEGKDPPNARESIHLLGGKDPPGSNTKAALAAYVYADPFGRDPVIFAGLTAIEEHLYGNLRLTRPDNAASKPAKLKKPPRQSSTNFVYTLQQSLGRMIKAEPSSASELLLVINGRQTPIPLAGEAERVIEAGNVKTARAGLSAGQVAEILSQSAAPELIMALALGMDPIKHANTAALIDVALGVVAAPLYDAKRLLDFKRPEEIDPAIKPLVPTPGHASCPGGHAAACYALCELLKAVIPTDVKRQALLGTLAERISKNREAAGLHVASDTAVGRAMGEAIGRWLGAEGSSNPATPWGGLYEAALAEW